VSLLGALRERGRLVNITVYVFARNWDCVVPGAIFGRMESSIYRFACSLKL
jgi:hypothetical protein